MAKQICWLATFNSNGTKELHYRDSETEPWKHHRTYPLANSLKQVIATKQDKGMSSGWAMQGYLRSVGYELVPSSNMEVA